MQPATANTRYSKILGLGSYRPRRLVGNEEIAPGLGLTPEWIRKRSGIETRRYASPDETLAYMSAAASEKALAAAGVKPAEIGCVVVATTTHLTQMPSLASQVAHQIGARGCGAMDILAACAGFPYALALGSDMVRCGSNDYALVIGAERITDILNTEDPATAFLFADGAGAVVVGPSDQPGIGPVVWGSDGSRSDAVGMTGYWVPELREDPGLAWPRLGMSGWKVYRWAVEELGQVAKRALEVAAVEPADLSAFIPHQANLLITNAIAKDLGLPGHVAIARDGVENGNTSAASIPLAMETLLSSGQVRSGGLGLLLGFGSGLVYAAQVVTLP